MCFFPNDAIVCLEGEAIARTRVIRKIPQKLAKFDKNRAFWQKAPKPQKRRFFRILRAAKHKPDLRFNPLFIKHRKEEKTAKKLKMALIRGFLGSGETSAPLENPFFLVFLDVVRFFSFS